MNSLNDFFSIVIFVILFIIVVGGFTVAPLASITIIAIVGWLIYKAKTTPKE